MRATRFHVLLAGAVAALALVVAPAAQAAAAPAGAAAKVRVQVNVQKFVVDRSGIKALGYATAAVGKNTLNRKVSLKVSRGARCSVLSLDLKELRLQLLGVHVDVGEVNLLVTGDPSRTLGTLFCKLSKATTAGKLLHARAAAASLSARLHARPMRFMSFDATIHPSTAAFAAATCDVLDLTIGPLNLDLLGLIVDLYGATPTKPVEAHVTADPTGGVLGSTFCKLAAG